MASDRTADEVDVTTPDAEKPVAIRQIARPKLVRDAALESIKHAIIHGRLEPGERLVERKLCEATGASRASIREVIRQLEADRLVTVTAHRGPAVARLTEAQAEEIYELRADLEARLVRAFCACATDGDVRELYDCFAEIKEAAKAKDKHALVEIMLRFNGHMMQVSGLEVTSDLLKSLLARISWLRVLSMTEPQRISKSVGEIGKILAAVKKRDAVAAEEAVRIYLRNAAQSALLQMRKRENA